MTEARALYLALQGPPEGAPTIEIWQLPGGRWVARHDTKAVPGEVAAEVGALVDRLNARAHSDPR